MNNNSIIIDQYLLNELTAAERSVFETRLSTEIELREELRIQQAILNAASNAGLKIEFGKAIRKKILVKKMLVSGVIAVTVLTVVLLAVKNNWLHYHTNRQSEVSSEIQTAEKFEIKTATDTIIETKDGVVFAIPAGAFKTDNKNINLEIKTALSPADIMKQGLSTMSDGNLLRTAGMFSIEGFVDEKKLMLTKEISVRIPAKKIDPAMQLFDGIEDSSGHIDWVNPKPIEKTLRTYDITTLDFYPPDYLPTLRALGKNYLNKKYTDSLYYSFSAYRQERRPDSPPVKTDYYVNEEIDRIFQPNGERLFKANCASCHKPLQSMTGPALHGIRKTIPKGDWIVNWVHNSTALAESGDAEAKRVKEAYSHVQMTAFPDLTKSEIEAILDYVDNYQQYEIDPSKIKAIWNEKFNKTILATREFEERLKFLHSLCTDFYFKAYTELLDHPLYYIDSVCAQNSSGRIKQKFLEFAARKDGGVKIASGLQQKLSNYFRQKSAAYKAAEEKTWAKYQDRLNQLNLIADEKQRAQEITNFKRENKNFEEELNINVTDAYRQIGQTHQYVDTFPPAEIYYEVQISTTGWKNLDAYVYDATENRQSMTYTDPVSGKVAKIIYNPVSIQIQHRQAFDKVMVYLIPDSLSSFQLVKETGNVFKEQLNALFKYGLVVLAYKKDQPYFYKQTALLPKDYVFNLVATTTKEMNDALQIYSGNKSMAVKSEFEYRLFEQQEILRQVQLRKDMELREQIAAAIFKCAVPADSTIAIPKH